MNNKRIQLFIKSLWLFCFYLYPISGIVKYIQNDSKHTFELFTESKSISNFIILLSLSLAFNKILKFKALFICSTIALVMGYSLFFEDILHPLLINLDLISAQSNPQWPRIVFITTSYLLLLVSLVKKDRTLDQFFSFTAISVLIVTTYLFHQATGSGVLQTAERNLKLEMSKALKLNHQDFENYCLKNNFYCLNDDSLIFQKKEEGLTNIKKHLLDHNSAEVQLIKVKKNEYQSLSVQSKEKRKIINIWQYNRLKMEQVNTFYFLSLAAHTFWSLISIILIFFHRKKQLNLLRKCFKSYKA